MCSGIATKGAEGHTDGEKFPKNLEKKGKAKI